MHNQDNRSVESSRLQSKHFLLITLTAGYAIAMIDRQLLVIVQESIKADLGLSDSQLGLLTGFAFALFYSFFGIPLGRIADKRNQTKFIAICMVVWSAFTAMVGGAHSFWHLLLLRIGVAAGEAGITPASCSLIARLYSPDKRSAAMSFYTIGAPIGLLIGFALGGRLEAAVGWRVAFIIASLPGILLAIFMLLFWKKPVNDNAGVERDELSLWEGLSHLWRARTIRILAIATPLNAFLAFAPQVWSVSYLVRVHEISIVTVGTWLGLSFGVGGIIGILATGLMADWLGKKNIKWKMWLLALNAGAGGILLVAGLLAPDGITALVCFLIPFALGSSYAGVSLSIVNTLAPEKFRATASAMFILVANIFGMGLGIWFVGIVSDALAPSFGVASIQYSLIITLPIAALLTVISYIAAGNCLSHDLSGTQDGYKNSCP